MTSNKLQTPAQPDNSAQPSKANAAPAGQDQPTAEDKKRSRSIREAAAKEVKKGKLDQRMIEMITNAPPISESDTREVIQWLQLASRTLKKLSSGLPGQKRWLRVTEKAEALEYRLWQKPWLSNKILFDAEERHWVKAISGTRLIAGGFDLLLSDDEHRREVIAALKELQLQYELEFVVQYRLEDRGGTPNCTLTLRELADATKSSVQKVKPALEHLIFRAIVNDYGHEMYYGPITEADQKPTPADATAGINGSVN